MIQQTTAMKKIYCIVLCFTAVQTFAFDTWWHAECTRKAATANGFSGDARLALQVSNYLTDYFPAYAVINEKLKDKNLAALQFPADLSFEFMHFDAIYSTEDIEKNWAALYQNTVTALHNYSINNNIKPGFRLIVFFNIIGSSLHIVQDYYSHSNWVNLYSKANTSPVPIWFDVPAEDRKKLKLATGAYPDGSVPGKLNHADLNKDCSTRELNAVAVETAERASVDWIKRLMAAVPEAPWGELKAYNIQNNMVMKRFLVKLDANFLTTTSILNDHLDGTKPVRFIFSKNKDINEEKRLAKIVVASTVADYLGNVGVAGNEYKLPSPYWAGYLAYHITHDLAAGLMHNSKVYQPPLKTIKNK
jgi:hypothetical protein